LHSGYRIAGHRLPAVLFLILPAESGLHVRKRKRGRSFGEAVSRKTFAANLLLDFASERGRGCRATDDNSAQAAQVVIVTLRTVNQSGGHDGNQATATHTFLLDQAENFFGVKSLDH